MRKFEKKIYDFMSLTANDTYGDLWIYGDITDNKWYDNDVTPIEIRDSLNSMGPVGTLNLRINSYGGSCVAGNTIVNLIDSYKRKTGANVHAYIDGIAASMGSGIAMAADYIYMAENAIFMVHKPYSVKYGNSFDMEKEAEVLEKVEDTLVKNYMRHFNGTEEEMRQLMADESWLTADEALELGLCDEIVPAVSVAASANGIRINSVDFINKNLKGKFKENTIGSDKMDFEYRDCFSMYLDRDSFDSLNVDSDTFQKITDAIGKYQDKIANENKENFEDTYYIGISKEDYQNAFGEEHISKDDILSLAKAGKEIDHEAHNKAKAYDKLFNAAIEDAIKSGVKAKGDNFNDSKWRKLLNALDYEEIVDQKNEWEAEAKISLNAGRRISQPWHQDKNEDNSAVNPNDYKF